MRASVNGRWKLRAGLAVAFALALALTIIYGRTVAVALRDLHPRRAPVDRALEPRLGVRPVAFPSADGVDLRGWYRPPGNGAVVLLVHGQGGSRQQMADQAEVLVRHGFGVLLFDLRAHGESGGDLATSGDRERRDVEGALAFLRARPEVERGRIGAVGFSNGAIAVAEVAARDPGILAVVLEAAPPSAEEDVWADYPKDRPLERSVGVLVHRLSGVDVGSVRPIDRLCAIAPRPILLVYGELDPGFPPATARRMRDAACGPRELWLVPGVGHGGYPARHPEEFERRLVGFLRAALLPPS